MFFVSTTKQLLWNLFLCFNLQMALLGFFHTERNFSNLYDFLPPRVATGKQTRVSGVATHRRTLIQDALPTEIKIETSPIMLSPYQSHWQETGWIKNEEPGLRGANEKNSISASSSGILVWLRSRIQRRAILETLRCLKAIDSFALWCV